MKKNAFNPSAWQRTSMSGNPSSAPMPTSPVNASDLARDVEIVLHRIEAQGVDITTIYNDWLSIGFAFADAFGEQGRTLFHRASKFFPNYDEATADKQYDKCLRSGGSGVTIRTFFGKAQKAGIDIRTGSYKSPISPKTPLSPPTPSGDKAFKGNNIQNNNTGDIGNNGDIGEMGRLELPTFSGIVTPNLPPFLQEIAKYGGSPQETDALLLGTLGVLSGCFPTVQGKYGGMTVYANFFVFISARASTGKGQLNLCRTLLQPIHRRLKDLHANLQAIYENDLAQWEGKSKKDRGPKPVKPKQTMLFIPADSSATAVYQLLDENGGRGIIFEPEADAVALAFDSDFGNYSNGFRRAFHHEVISYHRRGGDEDVEIENPQLSAVLTGTPSQIANLIKHVENGLFSRFAFLRLETDLEWKDVLSGQDSESLDSCFAELGEQFCQFYDTLLTSHNIKFTVTDSQRQKFNDYFSMLQQDYFNIFQDDIIGSVRRLGLICYRIAMVLSAVRLMDTGELPERLVCDDVDFDTALTISRTLAVHMAKIFDELSTADGSRFAAVAKTAKRKLFYAALPDDFDRQDYLEAADRTGVPPSTAEKWIRAFCEDAILEKVQHGRYRKAS